MASSAERQARYREKHRGRLRRFEVMLPRETFAKISELAEIAGLPVRETLERAVDCYCGALSGNAAPEKSRHPRTGAHANQETKSAPEEESHPQPTPDPDREVDKAFDLIQQYQGLGIGLTLRQAVQLVRQRR